VAPEGAGNYWTRRLPTCGARCEQVSEEGRRSLLASVDPPLQPSSLADCGPFTSFLCGSPTALLPSLFFYLGFSLARAPAVMGGAGARHEAASSLAFDNDVPRGVEGRCGSLGNGPAPGTVAERNKEGNLPVTVSGLRYRASPAVATYGFPSG